MYKYLLILNHLNNNLKLIILNTAISINLIHISLIFKNIKLLPMYNAFVSRTMALTSKEWINQKLIKSWMKVARRDFFNLNEKNQCSP